MAQSSAGGTRPPAPVPGSAASSSTASHAAPAAGRKCTAASSSAAAAPVPDPTAGYGASSTPSIGTLDGSSTAASVEARRRALASWEHGGVVAVDGRDLWTAQEQVAGLLTLEHYVATVCRTSRGDAGPKQQLINAFKGYRQYCTMPLLQFRKHYGLPVPSPLDPATGQATAAAIPLQMENRWSTCTYTTLKGKKRKAGKPAAEPAAADFVKAAERKLSNRICSLWGLSLEQFDAKWDCNVHLLIY